MNTSALQDRTEIPVIRIVDDDTSFRRALQRLLQVSGYKVREYASVGDLLLAGIGSEDGCLILDIHMPGPSGLDLQEMLAADGHPLPVIFMTGEATVHDSIRAMKAGAEDFLLKPLDSQALLAVLEKTLRNAACDCQERQRIDALRTRYATLSPRERQVLDMVTKGSLNKQISAALDVAERTVKAHRARVMQKMEVRTLAELARIVEQLHIVTDSVALPSRAARYS
ncbi:response regulator transcription factor [Glaciimonas soli]|uniref:Response regulator n=1 Tax=Glaciimonas soli TaxID=2590999 RepID=A0A843YWR7_9BURK|nr:response regulator [Glaciimonas soli]MQR01006.1 response regulator [Glaciimonas soli]